MRIWIAVLLAIVCCDDAALSQPIKHDVEVKPLIRNGTVVGCGIEYVAAFRDHTYRQGAVSGVSGSVTLMRPGNGREPTMMFKLLAVDFLGNDQGATQQFKVEHAKVFVENSVLANGVPMACENPLGGCSAHPGVEWFAVVKGVLRTNKLKVAYSRSREGLAVLVEMPVKVDTLESLSACIKQLR